MPESQETGNSKKADDLEDDPEYKPPVIYNVNNSGHGVQNSNGNLDGNCRTRPKRKITKPKTYEEFFHDFTGVSNLYFETDKFGTDLVFNYNQTHHVYRNKNRKSANGSGNSVDGGVCNTKSSRNAVVSNSIDTKGIDIKSDDDTVCGTGVTVNNRIMNFLNDRSDVAVGTDNISEAKRTESGSSSSGSSGSSYRDDKEVCIGTVKSRVNTSIDRTPVKRPTFGNVICDDEELRQIEFRNDDEEKEKSCDRLMEGFRTFLKLNAFNCFVDEVEKIPFFCFETEDGLNDYTEYSKNCIGASDLSKPRIIRKTNNSPVAARYSTDKSKAAGGTVMCNRTKKGVAGSSNFLLVNQEQVHRHRQTESRHCFKEQTGEEEEEEDDEMDCLQVRLNSEAGCYRATGSRPVKFYFKKRRDDFESSCDENSSPASEQRRRATANDKKANDSNELSDDGRDQVPSTPVKIEPFCSSREIVEKTGIDRDRSEVGRRRKRRLDNPFRRRTYEISFDELNSMLKLRPPKTLFYVILYLGVGRPLYPVVYENLMLAKALYHKEEDDEAEKSVADHDTTITKLWANFATSVLVTEKPDITAVRKIAFPVVHCKLSEPYCRIRNGRLYAIDYSSGEESQPDAIDDAAAASSAERKRRGRPKKRNCASRQHDHPVAIKAERASSEPISAQAAVEKSPVVPLLTVKNEKNSSSMFLRSFVGAVANDDEKREIAENPSASPGVTGIVTDDGDRNLVNGTSFNCNAYCSRTYGQRLNYLYRNSDEMYKYKLNAIFEKQRKNIQFFGVCEYVQVRKEESSSQQQQLQNNDNGNESGGNEAKLKFRSPSSDYNMRMAAIKHYFERIFSINKETGARHHISDVPSPLKFPSTVRWLLFRVETCFTSIVLDVREAIYHSEFLEILYKAELTKVVHRYRTVSFQSKYCRDNKREFGAYAFPGLCKLILLGPYNENERHRLSAVLKVDGRKPSTIPFKTVHFNERHFLFTKQKANKQEIDFTWWTPFVQRSDATVNELHLNSFFRLTDCAYNNDTINEEITSSELEQTCKVGKNLKLDLHERKADVTLIHSDIVDYGKRSKTEFSETLQRNLSFTDVVSTHKNTKSNDWLLKKCNNNVNCSNYSDPNGENGNVETTQMKEIFQREEDKFFIQECCNDAEVNDSKDELTSKKNVNTAKKERSRKRKLKESPVEADLDDNGVTENGKGERIVEEFSSDNKSASLGQKQPTENLENEKLDEIFPSFKIFEGVNEQDREEPTTVELYIVESGNDMAFDFEAEQDYQDDPLKIESVEDEANGTDSIESSSLLLYEDHLKDTKSVDSEILPDSGLRAVYPLDDEALNAETSIKKSTDPNLNIKKERRPCSRNLYKLRQSQVYRKDLSKKVAKLGSLVSNEKVPNYITKDVLHASRNKCIQLREEENVLMNQKLQSINSLLSLHSKLRSLLNDKIVNKKSLAYQKAKEIYSQLDIEWSHDEYSITVAEDGVLAKMMRTAPVNKDTATMATPALMPISKLTSLPNNISNAAGSEVISVSSDDDTDYSFTDAEILSNGTMLSVDSVTSETNSMDYCTPSNDAAAETESCITADSGGRLKRKRQSSKRLKDYIDVPDYIQDKEITDNTKKSIPSKKSSCSIALDVGECPVTIIGPDKHKKKQKSFVSRKSPNLPRRKSSTPTKSDSFLKKSSISAILDLNRVSDGTRKSSSFAVNNNRENVQDNKNGFYSFDIPMKTNTSLIIDASDVNAGPRWNTVLEDHSYCFQYERLPGTTGNRLKKGFRSLCNGTIVCVNGASTIKPRLERNTLITNVGQCSRGELTSGRNVTSTINTAAKKRSSYSAETVVQQKKSNNNFLDTAVKPVSHPVVMTTFPFNKNSQIQLLKHQQSTDSTEHVRRNFALDSMQLQQQKVKSANKPTVDATSDGSSSKPANFVHQHKNPNKSSDEIVDVDHKFKKNCTETQSSSCNSLKVNNSLIPEALYRRRGRPTGATLQNTCGSTVGITSKRSLPQSTSKLLPSLVSTSMDRRSYFVTADSGAIASANRTTQLKDILPPTLKMTATTTSTSISTAEDSAKGAKHNLSLQDEVTSPLEAFYKKVNFK